MKMISPGYNVNIKAKKTKYIVRDENEKEQAIRKAFLVNDTTVTHG